jgi:beta-galactosidase
VDVGAGRIVVVSDRSRVGDALKATLGDAGVSRVSKGDDRLDVVVHRDQTNDRRRVVFICNPTGIAISARVGVDVEIADAAELWDGGVLPIKEGKLALELSPYSITVADVTVQF